MSENRLPSASRLLMDPQKLQQFLAVFENRNFARAAEACGVTQQAVSKSIARIEESIGVKLFERGAFGAEPTAYGRALAKRAKIIVTETRLAAAELNALKGATDGFVKVGFGWSFLPRIAPQVINRFRRRRPGVTVSVVSGPSVTLFNKLLAGEIEFVASAPAAGIKIDDALDASELFMDWDVIVMRAGHPLANKAVVTLEELSNQTWIISLALQEHWRKISEAFVSAGLSPPSQIVDLDSLILAKSMIEQSDCIALLGREQVSLEIERGDFKVLERPEFPQTREGYFTVRRGAVLQPAAKALKSDLVHVCKTLYLGDSFNDAAPGS